MHAKCFPRFSTCSCFQTFSSCIIDTWSYLLSSFGFWMLWILSVYAALDKSSEWVKHMMAPDPVELPNNAKGLEKILFRDLQ